MRLLYFLIWFFMVSPLFAADLNNEQSSFLLSDYSGAETNEDIESKNLATLNQYYGNEVHNFASWQEKIEKAGSAAFSATGMISLYFLGAELVNNTLDVEALGYVLGPLFEIPVACIAYQAQNSLLKQLKKTCNADWRSLEAKEKSYLKKFAKGGYYIIAGSLGAIMSSVAVYYTNYYLEPMIGNYVWLFIPPACLSNTLMASLGTMSLLNFFSTSLSQHVFKGCQSTSACKRTEIKKALAAVIMRLEKNSTLEAKNSLELIRSNKMVELIAEKEISFEEQAVLKESSFSCYEKGKVASGWTGGIVAIIGSIAMIPATQIATEFILESWCGVDPTIALPLSGVCGLLGGITMAGYRGNSNKATFQRIYDMGGACVKINPKNPSSNAGDKIKTIMGEALTWTTSIAAVAPRVQIILYSMTDGPLRDTVVGCNIIATACNDYFGWKKFPDSIKDYFFIKNDKDKMLAVLNALHVDIDHLSEEVIHELYERLITASEDIDNAEDL